MLIRTKYHHLALLFFFALVLGGCDQLTAPNMTAPEPAASSHSQPGTVRVLLTDAPFPFDLVESANVEIERVELLSDEEGVQVLSEEEQAFNLLTLRNGVTTPLGEIELPAGRYDQIRLIVDDSASVVLKNGTRYDLKVPSGTETGIKVLTGGLEISGEEQATITLDFNVEESFVVQGNPNTPAGIKGFIFKPVVKLKDIDQEEGEEEIEDTGELTGTVDEINTSDAGDVESVVIGGTEILVNGETSVEGLADLSELAPGSEVYVEYTEQDDGDLLALEIGIAAEEDGGEESGEEGSEDAESQGEVTGIVNEVNTSDAGEVESIVVGDTEVLVNAETVVEGLTDLSELTLGSEVHAEYVEQEDGSLLALEIEVSAEETSDDQSEVQNA